MIKEVTDLAYDILPYEYTMKEMKAIIHYKLPVAKVQNSIELRKKEGNGNAGL